jgi:hypothetical protein
MKEVAIGDLTFGDLQISDITIDTAPIDMDVPVYDDPADITAEAEEQLSETAQKVKAQEDKLRERFRFEQDNGYFFSVCFESKKARDAFLTKHKIKLIMDNHVFYEEVKGLFGEV